MKPIDLITGTNPLLADRVRLAIMVTLAASSNPVDFSTLMRSLDLTKGNLSSHLRKLEDGGLIKVNKRFVNRRPNTTYKCSIRGKQAIKTYLEMMERIIKRAMHPEEQP